MVRGLLFCWVTEFVIQTASDTRPLGSPDSTTASFSRICSICALRTLWGVLRVWRGDCAGVAYEAPRSSDSKSPEMKVAEVAFESLLKVSCQTTVVCGV